MVEEYSTLVSAPVWLHHTPELLEMWEKDFQGVFIESKELTRNLNSERSLLQAQFTKNLGQLEDKFNIRRENLLINNPILIINGITVQSLPIELTEETLSMDSESRNSRLKDILATYKAKLLTDFNNGVITSNELLELIRKD